MTNPRSAPSSGAQGKLGIFRLIPPKLAIFLIALAIVYALGQPYANRQFSWTLPSLASILELNFEPDSSSAPSVSKEKFEGKPATPVQTPKQSPPAKVAVDSKSSQQPADRTAKAPPTRASAPGANQASDLRFGILKNLGNERFISPAGLIYARGSEDGHRLNHLERHLEDQPNRPGSHGVFEGDMALFLKTIDDAFQRTAKGARGTSRKSEDGMTVFEVSFDKPIGYIGGSTGKRKSNPDAYKLRLVLSDKNVITAFPF